jgi:phage terminase large subunit-like protein
MIATMATLQRDLAALRREVAAIKPPPADRSILELAAVLGLELDPWQRDVLTTGKKEILMLAARQTGKSTVAALMATHQTVAHPGSLTLILSPGERQSKLLLKTVKKFSRALPDAPVTLIENQLSIELANGSEVHALPGT